MKTLYVIDGYAQFFRAYHAIRTPMSSPVTGEPTNLTFGFVGMLLKLLRGEGAVGGMPDYVAVALDVSGDRGTFRSGLYPEYKATRPPPPEDLPVQVERCLRILREIGVPIVGAEGFEADDVIATVVDRLKEQHPDLRVRIVSKDKDLKQLLRDNVVELYDVHHDAVIDEAKLREETGLSPAQVVDMLALMGDTVDNVPGVEGVGPKTAAQLIAEYGSLDALLARADEIKGKRGEKLREAAPRLGLSRQLVTLRRDAPAELDLEAASVRRLRLERLLPILKELGFNRYQDEVRELLAGPGARRPDEPGTGEESGAFADSLFAQAPGASVRPKAEGDYRCVRTRAELDALVEELRRAPAVSVDTETTSVSPMRAALCGLCFAVGPGAGWYVPVRSPEQATHLDERAVLDALRPVLEDPDKPKLGHNLKYDMLVLRRHGVELRGLSRAGGNAEDFPSCDSMVASYLIDSSRSSHGLDALALALLGRTNISIKELIGTGKTQRTFDQVPLEQATPYAAEDADVALQLARAMAPRLRAMGLMPLFAGLEMPLVEVLAELEWNGILVDPDELDRQRQRLESRIADLKSKISDAAFDALGRTFDPDSPKQLAAVLFNRPDSPEPGLGLRATKRGKTGPSTDAEVLEKLAEDAGVESPIPRLVLDYRQLTKLVSTYLVSLRDEINPETKRIHASFNQTVAATGRLSSSDPNLQNIPIRTDVGREIRKAFVAPPGRVLITADYSQIELRLLAHLSRDPALIAAFREGQDIHAAVAAQIHGVPVEKVTREQRNGAKMVNFGIVYGITPYGLARRLGVSNTEATEIIDGYKRRFAGITTFLQECVEQATRRGYVETMMKRRRSIPDIESTNPQRRALAERTAINSVVQGSAADLIKIAMVDLHRRLSPHAAHHRGGRPPEIEGVRMLLQIHDELVFEAPEERAEEARRVIVDRMEHAMTLDVPLVADSAVSRDWHEAK
ncbi:MAG: DNA polymerase I [Leptolyngbya sp. PLA2]|nr:DNA polymerase I [Leptolyngbya sp.]MCE7972111.1 DNA polymerase I [Leptolyngbya sp. PL-A2]MCQ3941494.1 DNA polymerase I [cyanobacterium CYA1]MCZ7634518.1 DNA polymerase I [Phycisphaerales bacterium]MDL1905714.1 DNA polymerase I [Synechococcales cyanobacterium CNB]GIK20482.1 MAG: DNA polymerase I [Planctomycetota bacterium]